MLPLMLPVIASLLSAIAVRGLENEFCDISEQHVMCQNVGSLENCKPYELMRRTLTEEEKLTYLHDVNVFRSKIARGMDESFNLPNAANMQRMVWNEELEIIAQADADRCDNQPRCSDCYNTRNMKTEAHLDRYAISIPKGAYPGFFFVRLILTKFIRNSKDLINVEDIQNYTLGNNDLSDLFSQIIRAKMDQVGCGVTTLYYMANTTCIDFYSCVRGPGFESGEIYKIGPACSECPENTVCSETYEGLCEEPAPTTIDPNSITQPPATTTDDTTTEDTTPEVTTTTAEVATTTTEVTTTTTEVTTVTEQTEPSKKTPGFTVDFTTPDWESNVSINFTSTSFTTSGPTSIVESSTDLVISSGDRVMDSPFWRTTLLFFFVSTLL